MLKVNSLKLNEPDFPLKLKQIYQPPAELFWRGSHPSEWAERPAVAVVGSRKITAYGLRVTLKICRSLAQRGVLVISGLALGVDGAAHRAALEAKGYTVAVLGNGIDNIYPVSHQGLARQIIGSGGSLISEYPPGTPGMKPHFIARNRLISGLADVVIIAEAALRSGSLHTARFGLEQGKTVMVIPGEIDDPNREGCHNLLKSGAWPLTNIADVWQALGLPPEAPAAERRFDDASSTVIYELIRQGIVDQEAIAVRAGLTPSDINRTLTVLEIDGAIRPLGAGRWTVT